MGGRLGRSRLRYCVLCGINCRLNFLLKWEKICSIVMVSNFSSYVGDPISGMESSTRHNTESGGYDDGQNSEH